MAGRGGGRSRSSCARHGCPCSSRPGQKLPSSPQLGWRLPACSSRQPGRRPPTHISCSAYPTHHGWGGTCPRVARDGQDETHPRTAHNGPQPAHSSCSTRRVWRPTTAFSTGPTATFFTGATISAPWASSTPVNSTCRRASILPSTRRCCAETICCKHLFQVFVMFHRDVASVLYRCCKSRSGCCTCCNCVSSVCSKCFHLFSDICCKCFIGMLQK